MHAPMAALSIPDYIIFALMLLISASIGIYFRFSGGMQKTTEEYLLAGKGMAILPVAFSLMASFMSAVTVIGIPSEMYRYGANFVFINIGFSAGPIIAAYLFLPVFFNMQASTVYKYLEIRYGKLTRTVSSLAFVIQMILYMAVVLYAPAIALSAVTNLSTWVSVVSVGVVCTFYCTLGGMKAVLWTDVFQAVLMFLGVFSILIKGCIDVGGITNVFRIAGEGGRLVIPGWELDLTTRYTMWNIVLNGVILSMSSYGTNQVQIQRMLTVKNIKRSRTALFISIPMAATFHLLTCLAGVILYANFSRCDPLTSPEKPITADDQLMPYYMMLALGQFPGLPGLCICGIFSASLSTVSSAVNSLTAVTMEDFIRPMYSSRGISQAKTTFLAKVTTLFYGALCVGMTFVVANFGNLIQASLTVFGMLGGPVLAVFFLGMLTTRANEKGVIVGLVLGVTFSAWISFGSSSSPPPSVTLPVSTEGCSVDTYLHPNLTALLINQTTKEELFINKLNESMPSIQLALNASSDVESGNTTLLKRYIFPLYRISYMWVTPIGFSTSVIVGYLVSIIAESIFGKGKEVPRECLSPALKWFLKEDKIEKKEIEISSPVSLQIPNGKETSQLKNVPNSKNTT